MNEVIFEAEPPGDLEAERERLEEEVERYVKVVAISDDVPELVAELRERRRELRAVAAQIASRKEPLDRKKLRAAIEQICSEWREVLRSNVGAARTLIKSLIGELHVHGEPVPRWLANVKPETTETRSQPNLELLQRQLRLIDSANSAVTRRHPSVSKPIKNVRPTSQLSRATPITLPRARHHSATANGGGFSPVRWPVARYNGLSVISQRPISISRYKRGSDRQPA